MKRVKIMMIGMMFVLMVPAASFARDLGAIYTDCGIGGLIFKDIPVGAIISNIIWDLGTTATMSDVSSADSCKGKGSASASFIHESYVYLDEETAQGDGEHLHALLNIAGCAESTHAAMISQIREKHANVLTSPSYTGMSSLDKSKAYYIGFVNTVQGAPGCAM